MKALWEPGYVKIVDFFSSFLKYLVLSPEEQVRTWQDNGVTILWYQFLQLYSVVTVSSSMELITLGKYCFLIAWKSLLVHVFSFESWAEDKSQNIQTFASFSVCFASGIVEFLPCGSFHGTRIKSLRCRRNLGWNSVWGTVWRWPPKLRRDFYCSNSEAVMGLLSRSLSICYGIH